MATPLGIAPYVPPSAAFASSPAAAPRARSRKRCSASRSRAPGKEEKWKRKRDGFWGVGKGGKRERNLWKKHPKSNNDLKPRKNICHICVLRERSFWESWFFDFLGRPYSSCFSVVVITSGSYCFSVGIGDPFAAELRPLITGKLEAGGAGHKVARVVDGAAEAKRKVFEPRNGRVYGWKPRTSDHVSVCPLTSFSS